MFDDHKKPACYALEKRIGEFMRNTLIALAVLNAIALPTAALAAGGSETAFKKFPETAGAVKGFVPTGWTLESSVEGDLNKDGTKDVVAVIAKYVKEGDFDRDVARAVVIAFREGGKLRKVAVSDKIARLSADSGMLGTPTGAHVTVAIERGSVVLDNLWGSREAEKDTFRFRYDAASKKFQLIGKDVLNYDRGSGDQQLDSKNLITGDRVIEKSKIGDSGDPKVLSKKKSKFKTSPLLTFEQVDSGAE